MPRDVPLTLARRDDVELPIGALMRPYRSRWRLVLAALVASWVGGVMLVRWANLGVTGIVWLALGCFAVAALVAWRVERTLG